ncbi:MAG: MarR family transcriptional regulator [Alphaproteobacteria bacterium]|nr:MarR family transcriptional regulator [Alphaproteobacteria bacterium]
MKLQDHLGYMIASVNKQLEDELQERLRAEGMPLDRWRVLEVLAEDDHLAMGELATRALIEPTTLTKIIDRMVADGLVLRLLDALDRRRVLVALAPAGKAAVRRLSQISTSQEARIKKRMPKAKLDQLRTLLRGLADQ